VRGKCREKAKTQPQNKITKNKMPVHFIRSFTFIYKLTSITPQNNLYKKLGENLGLMSDKIAFDSNKEATFSLHLR
jgi:hypothetical protein